MFNMRGAKYQEFRSLAADACEVVTSGLKDGLSRIKLNKIQASFVVIAFTVVVCAAVAVGLAINSAELSRAYRQSPFGGNTVTLDISADNSGISGDDMTSFAAKNGDVFESVVPYKTADKLDMRGNTGSVVTGSAIVTDDRFFEYAAAEVVRGAAITAADLGRNVVLISEDMKEDLFGESDPLGQSLKINNRAYTVIGIVHGTKGWELSGSVIVPLDAARLILNSSEIGRYVFIVNDDISRAETKVNSFVSSNIRKIAENEFTVTPGSGTRNAGTGTEAFVFVIMLLISGFILIMFMLFPTRRNKRSHLSGGLRRIHSVSSGVCAAFLPTVAGTVVGAAAGVLAARLYCTAGGFTFFVPGAAPIILPMLAAVIFAVVVAAVVSILSGGDNIE